MFPSPFPCTNVNECTSLTNFSHHPMAENDKHQEWKSKNACHATMLDGLTTNQIKGMRKTHWTSTRRAYEIWWYERGMVNQSGKHRWYLMMQSMSESKEEKIVTPKASAPWKLMITCVWCIMSGDKLNLLLLHLSDQNQNKEHVDTTNGIDGPLV